MANFRFLVFLIVLMILGTAQAASDARNYYRSFWSPCYHGQRLDYCASNHEQCGLSVANRYCRLMGYERTVRQSIDYNVGETHYLSNTKPCKGWDCNGFTLIRCVSTFKKKPTHSYSYRSQQFVFPRFNHARVDWCYEKGTGCGRRAAYSFCRRMGYMRAQSYKIQRHVSETRALSNHQLCVGRTCNAFSQITCYR